MAHAGANPAVACAGCDPSTATRIATPSAEPICRAADSTADPDASSEWGTELAVANSVGWISALATPHSSMLGSTTTG